MGTLGTTTKLATFQNDIYPSGLDLNQGDLQRVGGYFKANASTTFEQGMIVALNASNEVVLGDGGSASHMLGVAKWNKTTAGTSLIVDEPHVVDHNAAVALAHANVSGVIVRNAVDSGSAAAIPATNNYTLSAANGTLTWDNPPSGTNAPADGATVYVTYSFALTDADRKFIGRNFFNFVDDVSIAEGRIAVIMPPALLFTSKFVSSLNYTVGETLYMGGVVSGEEGLFTNSNSSSPPIAGMVIQTPTAQYPFLGVELRRA